MAQCVKVLALQPDNLCSIPRIHMVKEENQHPPYKLSFIPMPLLLCIHTKKINVLFILKRYLKWVLKEVEI